MTVTDANGCSSTALTNINEPTALVSSITDSNDVSCNGGSDGFATVSVSGGIAPYTYLWDNGEINASAFGLNVGIHNVTVCLLYTSPSPRDGLLSRMPSSA